MVLALVLLVLGTLLYLFIGVVLLLVPEGSAGLQTLVDSIGWPAGITPQQQVQVIRIFGGISTGVAVVDILFAVIAFTGRNWARIVLTALTVAFVLLTGYLAVSAGGDVTSLGLVLASAAASVVGTVLLYLRGPGAYFARRRR
jgi:hypothetical protein